ncbi:MAG: hypothetical protein ACP5JJ_07200 [Anaerolineae bacterium]
MLNRSTMLPLLGAGLVIEVIYLVAGVRLSWWEYGSHLQSWSHNCSTWGGGPFVLLIVTICLALRAPNPGT